MSGLAILCGSIQKLAGSGFIAFIWLWVASLNRFTSEWLAIFLAAFITLLVIVIKGGIYMPLFTFFVALGFGVAATLPMSLVYAISGFGMQIGFFNELVVSVFFAQLSYMQD